eukprot:m.237726 g.237726  ORF g.237726 m.237726 type:complete len:185 (-) comp21335_c0_seq1:56-610(-)
MASQRTASILDRPNAKARGEISLSTFAFLFSEMVRYSHQRSESIPDLERNLSVFGQRVGARLVEMVATRERGYKREIKLNGLLVYIQTVIWKTLFGKAADFLGKDNDRADTYMISDRELPVNKYISVPSDLAGLNCGAFVAGIVEAVLEGARFPAHVSAHAGADNITTILMRFDLAAIPADALG